MANHYNQISTVTQTPPHTQWPSPECGPSLMRSLHSTVNSVTAACGTDSDAALHAAQGCSSDVCRLPVPCPPEHPRSGSNAYKPGFAPLLSSATTIAAWPGCCFPFPVNRVITSFHWQIDSVLLLAARVSLPPQHLNDQTWLTGLTSTIVSKRNQRYKRQTALREELHHFGS